MIDITKAINCKKEIKKFSSSGYKKDKKVLDAYYDELQTLEASNNFLEFLSIPRKPYARSHKLHKKYVGYWGIGLLPEWRMVLKCLNDESNGKCQNVYMRHVIYDYHKD